AVQRELVSGAVGDRRAEHGNPVGVQLRGRSGLSGPWRLGSLRIANHLNQAEGGDEPQHPAPCGERSATGHRDLLEQLSASETTRLRAKELMLRIFLRDTAIL